MNVSGESALLASPAQAVEGHETATSPTTSQSSFTTKNLFYLKITSTLLLPTTLLIRKQHLQWITKEIFQDIVLYLQPLLLDALTSKRTDQMKSLPAKIHRTLTYQIAYYLKPTDLRYCAIVGATPAQAERAKKQPQPKEEEEYSGFNMTRQMLVIVAEPYSQTPDFLGIPHQKVMTLENYLHAS